MDNEYNTVLDKLNSISWNQKRCADALESIAQNLQILADIEMRKQLPERSNDKLIQMLEKHRQKTQ